MIQTSKKLYVPAELTPATTEGVLTSADAIYDYNLKKSQLELNIYFKLSLNDYLDPLKIDQAISRLASDIKTTIKERPEAFIKNVHYQNEFDHTSKITDYAYPNQEVRRDDLPLPVLMQVFGSVLSITEEPGFTNTLEFEIRDGDIISIYNLIPNKLYFYSTDSGIEGKFYVKDSRRFIYADNIWNVRDLGGIPVSNGGYIAYNKIFRGGELKGARIDASPVGLKYLKDLGINCEVDLRSDDESKRQTSTMISGAEYFKESFVTFDKIKNLSDSSKASIKRVFEYVADRIHAGKVIYAHCVFGYHRCGFLMSLIEGVLGAKLCEIDKDYEMSSFSPFGLVVRNDSNYTNGITALKDTYDGSWTNLLLDCGVSMETINQFRSDMIICSYNINESLKNFFEVTYEQLIQLRNTNSLIPDCKYRIIDYDTCDGAITAYASCSGIPDLPKFKSAYHHFDLLLTALSTNELDSNVKAIYSVRDTEGYFKNQDLAKWEIKYDLDNDNTKYSWAVPNGKGVIYYMKDEYNNELPYDFKNIMFEYKGSWYYTFNNSASNVVIKPLIDNLGLHLNKNVFINSSIVKDCFFDFNTHENIILGNCVNFSIGKYSSNNELKNVDTCVIESDCYNIKSENSENLYIKDGCYNLNIIVSEPMFIAYNTANKTIDNDYLPDILSQEEFNVIFN